MNRKIFLGMLLFLCLSTTIGYVRADGYIIDVGPILRISSPSDVTLAPCNTTTLNWVIDNIAELGVPELHYVTFTAVIRNNSLVEIVPAPSYTATYEVRDAHGILAWIGDVNGVLTVEPFGFWDPTGVQQYEMVTWRLPDYVVLLSGWRINLRFQIHCEAIGVTTILLFPRATEDHGPTNIIYWTNLWQENGIWYLLQRSYDPWDDDIESGHIWRKGWIRYKGYFPYGVCIITQTGAPPPYPPTANFTESTHTPYVGFAVYFDASGSTSGFDGDDICPITSYEWNFGDGNITTEADPYITHVYLAPGLYTVIMKVTAPGILPNIHPLYVNWDTTSAEKNTTHHHPPEANFTESTHTPMVGYAVYFDASGSTSGFDGDDICPITSYTWDFGDGNITTESDPYIAHVYLAEGTYTVILNVTAPGILPNIHPLYVNWDTASAEKNTTRHYPPEANFTESTHTPQVGQAIYFDASGSKPGFDGDDICPITSYTWDFGDGNITTEADPYIVHVYLAPGTYTVIMNVTAPGILPNIHPLYVNWDTASAQKSTPTGEVGTPGFWGHQVIVYLIGRGTAQMTEEQLFYYLQQVSLLSNYTLFKSIYIGSNDDTLVNAWRILRNLEPMDNMTKKLERQLLCTLLNYVSSAVGWDTELDPHIYDGFDTVGEVIVYAEHLLIYGGTFEELELAHTMCDNINNGKGLIP